MVDLTWRVGIGTQNAGRHDVHVRTVRSTCMYIMYLTMPHARHECSGTTGGERLPTHLVVDLAYKAPRRAR